MTAAKKKRTGKAAYEVSTHFFTAIGHRKLPVANSVGRKRN